MKDLAIMMAAFLPQETLVERIKESCEEYLKENDPQKKDINKVLFHCSMLAINHKCEGNPDKAMEMIGRVRTEESTEEQEQEEKK